MARYLTGVCLILMGSTVAIAQPSASWTTFRGNPARTGNTDQQPIPDSPNLLWSIKSQDHFVASLVPLNDAFYVAGLGAFNKPTSSVYPLSPSGEPKPIWSRSAPYLRMASVSSPAIVGNRILFGDGMHQDAGGILHCLTADLGKPIWQLPLPGDLVHLEGAPVVHEGKVYMGGGSAGVICVEAETALLDGKELTTAEIEKRQEAKWKELQARFEADKKKDPTFAVPPSEDQLLKPTPKRVWQKGEQKWHVDSPLNLAGDKLLVATSYLEKEKLGERAVYALNSRTGETIWSAPLKLNPWGGASVLGDTVILTGSSVGFYYSQLKGAKGDITALDLATGKERWRKEVPGGVVGCAALAGDLVICTATDGKVRAFALADGERRWIYDAKIPLFAPPAVVADTVYIGDLLGSITAIGLKDGGLRWKKEIGKELGAGMIYGGPIAVKGKLLVATCNLEGPFARKPTWIACLGK